MAAESPGSTEARAGQGGWQAWLRVAVAALILLLFSEALWLWQTWPVRELLHNAPVPASHQP
jgi:hypothetical protein